MSELEKQLAVRDQPRPEMLPKFEFLRAEEPARGQTTDKRLKIKPYFAAVSNEADTGKPKIAVPVKRINKKLADIMTEVETGGEQVCIT